MVTKEHALKYLEKGWSIFPIKLEWIEKDKKWNKVPLVKWTPYMKELPTKEEIDHWFTFLKPDGLGLATGKKSGVVVIDVEGYAKPEDYEDIKSGMVSNTISGGKHFYFKWDKELRNTVKIKNKAIDFRGDGGYVVLPPSGKGDSKYSWGKSLDPMYLDTLPTHIEEQLVAETVKPIEFIDGEMPFPPAGEGGRNNESARIAGYLCTTIPRKLLEVSGWNTLREWNKTNSPPLMEDELRKTWESIKSTDYRKHPNRQGEKIEIYDGVQALHEYDKMVSKWGAGLSTGFYEIDEYLKLLPEQLYLVSAPTHHGKTTFTLNLASRMASLGTRVLFCSLEQGVFIAPRVKTILGGEYPEELSLLTSSKLLTTDDIEDTVNSMVHRPEFIVIDHLHFMDKGKKDKTQAIDDMIIAIQQMAINMKLPVMVVAHVRKLNGKATPDLDDLRDSSSLSQVPSAVLMLKQDENKSVEDMIKNKRYLSGGGVLMIMKNRITGKTGALRFTMKGSGEFDFGKKDYDAAKEIFNKRR